MMSSSEKTKSNKYFECGDEQRDNRVFGYGPESSTKPLFSQNAPVTESSASRESQSKKIFDPKYNQPIKKIREIFGDDFIKENEDDGEVVLLDLSNRTFDYAPDPPFGHNAPQRVTGTPDDEIRSRRVFHYGPVEPNDKPLFDHNTPAVDKNSVDYTDRAPPVGQVVPTDRSGRKFTYGPEEPKEPLFDHNKPYNAYTANVDEIIYIDGQKHRREFHFGPADVPAKPLFDHNRPVVDNNAGTSYHNQGVIGGGLKVTDEERNARKFHYGPEEPKKPLFDHNTPVTIDRRGSTRAFIDLEEERENRAFDSPVPVGKVEERKQADTKAWFDDESLVDANDDDKDLETTAGSLLDHDIPASNGDNPSNRDEDNMEDTMALKNPKEISIDDKTHEEEEAQETVEALLDQDTAVTSASDLSKEDNKESIGDVTVLEESIEAVNADNDLDKIEESKIEEAMSASAEISAEQSITNEIAEDETLKINNVKESDYYKAIESLEFALKETDPKLSEVRLWASDLWDVLKTNQKVGTNISKSMAAAKAAIEAHGPESPEAKEAWSYLESCASGRGYLENTVLDTTLLQEAADALAVLEHLSDLVNQEKERLDEDTQ